MNAPAPTRPAADYGSEALSQALGVSFRILRYLMWGVIALYLLSGLFQVRPNERAMVLVLGKLGDGPDRLLGPGFHITLPRPFAEVVRVPAETIRTVATDAFWQPELSVDPTLGEFDVRRNLAGDEFGYTLTGDANVLHSQWALRYTVADPEAFAFGFGRAVAADRPDAPPDELWVLDQLARGREERVSVHLDEILRTELEHAVLKTSARLTIDQALRTDQEAFRTGVEAELEDRIRDLGLGVEIEGLDMVDSAPPPSVQDAFDAVINAGNAASTRIDTARAYAERRLNEAGGDAAGIRAAAEAYRQRLVDEVRADADYFDKVKGQFAEHPEILYRTLLQDTLVRALRQVDEKFVLHEGRGNQELRIRLSPPPRTPALPAE